MTLEEAGYNFANVEKLEDFRREWENARCSRLRTYAAFDLSETFQNRALTKQFKWGFATQESKIEELPTQLVVRNTSLQLGFGSDATNFNYRYIESTGPEHKIQILDQPTHYLHALLWLPSNESFAYMRLAELSGARPFINFVVQDEPSWNCRGPFAECFAALAWFSRDKPRYSLQDLSDAIDDQLSGFQPHDFEVLGIKFPVEHQALWGIIALLALQLYLCLHLRELSPSLTPKDDGLNVAWIGLYPSLLSRAVTWTSILILPLVSIALLAQNGMHYESPLWPFLKAHKLPVTEWFLAPATICTLLALSSCLAVTRLATKVADARKLDDTPSADAAAV
jgi:hypothetical protein